MVGGVKETSGPVSGPKDAFTGEDGTAVVLYPQYRDAEEGIRTTSVSLHVDHPDFAYIDALHIDVPLESEETSRDQVDGRSAGGGSSAHQRRPDRSR